MNPLGSTSDDIVADNAADRRAKAGRSRLDAGGAKSGGKRRRKQVRKACARCQKAHAACTNQRPCQRCVQRGEAHLCVDVPRKNRKSGESSGEDSCCAPAAKAARPPRKRRRVLVEDNPDGERRFAARDGGRPRGEKEKIRSALTGSICAPTAAQRERQRGAMGTSPPASSEETECSASSSSSSCESSSEDDEVCAPWPLPARAPDADDQVLSYGFVLDPLQLQRDRLQKQLYYSPSQNLEDLFAADAQPLQSHGADCNPLTGSVEALEGDDWVNFLRDELKSADGADHDDELLQTSVFSPFYASEVFTAADGAALATSCCGEPGDTCERLQSPRTLLAS